MKKAQITIWIIRVLMLVAVIFKLCIGESWLAIYCTIAIGITFSPELMNGLLKIEVPMWLRMTLTIFTFFAMTIAKLFYLYEHTIWWDKFLHLGSGVILAYVGLMIAKHVTKGDNHIIILFFSLAFAIACAAIWEIWEFSGDMLFGLDSQIRATGVNDTMGDIISGTIGAILTIPHLRREIDE